MIVNEFPDRKILVENVEYLYFGGTNYLGMTTNVVFQNILFESIKKWGTGYGSSRSSNIKLSIYETAEKLLAKNLNTEAALAVSSGMLAGKLVVDYLSKTTNAMFHFPDAHPALMNPPSLPIIVNGKLNSKLFDKSISKITVLTDAVPSQYVEPIDLEMVLTIPNEIEINLVLDESNSFGILENEWQNYLKKENINIIKVASLGKAIGISGGVIAGNESFISEIKNQASFIGAAGMNPAFLETYCNAQEIYFLQKQKRSIGVSEKELIKIAVKSMGLDELGPFKPEERVIEYLLKYSADSKLVNMTLADFANETSSESPAPGGGSIAAYVGALGVSLATMVANLSSHKKGWDERWEEFGNWAEKGEKIKNELVSLVDADTKAFNKIMEAFGLPKSTDEEKLARTNAIQEATKFAIEIPFQVMMASYNSMEVIKAMAEIGNPNSVSDAGVGALCARSAVKGAFMNVRINTNGYNDKVYVAETLKRGNFKNCRWKNWKLILRCNCLLQEK